MRNSIDFISIINTKLFEAEFRRLEENIVRMNQQNREAGAEPSDGFIHKGHSWIPKGLPRARPKLVSLQFSLQDAMDDHIADRSKILDDMRQVHQLLFKLLEPCFCEEDVRDAVPECVIDTLPDIHRKYQRCRNPQFFLRHPRDYALFARVHPLMEFYSATRLLY